jgi:hypothetical protein
MFKSKKALALLGLFFCLSPVLRGEEPLKGKFDLGLEAGTLWVDADGISSYGLAAFSLGNQRGSFFEFGAGTLRSDLPFFAADLSVFRFGGGTALHGAGLPLGFRFTGTYFEHGDLRITSGETVIENQGGKGFFFSTAVPVTLAGFTLTPSWTYGSGYWDEGSFYWFLGRPELAALQVLGFSLDYRGMHTLDIGFLMLDLDIINNLKEFLFDGELTGLIPSYRFTLDTGPLRFEGLLGWFHGSLSLDGALTASNQHYAFFPYSYYNVDIRSPLDAGYATLDFRYRRRIFQGHFTLGAFRFFSGGFSGDMDFKYKTLFGGNTEQADVPLRDIRGVGAAFLLLDGGLVFDRHGAIRAGLSLQKAFIIPFGLDVLSPGSPGSPGGEAEDTGETAATGSLLRSVLLSGWTIRFKLEW